MKHLRNNMKRMLIASTMFVCCFMLISGAERVHAGAGGIGGGEAVVVVSDMSPAGTINPIKNTLSEISNAFMLGIQQSLNLKEFTLDAIARNVAQTALNQLTADMVNWINGGMNGEPSFVTDLDAYLLGVADEAVGSFIYGTDLDALCEPIRFQVKAAILTQYTQDTRGSYTGRDTPQCSLDDMFEVDVDVEAFREGEFSQGGWGAYFELGIGSNNDLIKAYFDSSVESNTRARDAQLLAQEELRWGDGFLGKKACTFIETATGFAQRECETITPPALVRDTLAYFVGELPAQRLLQIDEFNEAFTALGASLTNQAIAGTFGLLGLGGNEKYSDARFGDGSQSYLDALRDEQFLISGSGGETAREIFEAIEAETTYQALQQSILDDIADLEEALEEGEERYPQCFDLELSDELEDDKAEAETNIETSVAVMAALQELETAFRNATSTEAENRAYQTYAELQARGFIQTEFENERVRLDFIEYEFQPRVEAFEAEIEEELDRCG